MGKQKFDALEGMETQTYTQSAARIAVTVRVTSYVARLVDAADDGSYPKHTIL